MRRRLLCCAAFLLASCDGWRTPTGPKVLGLDEWETVLAIPARRVYQMTSSPDGAIFLSMFDGSIWRGGPGRRWEQVAATNASHLTMYAPSATTLFAAEGPRIFRWDQGRGIREEETPISATRVRCLHTENSEQVEALWGRGAADVYAVGPNGLVVHYDGAAWKLEPNPLRDAAASSCQQSFANALYSVGGNDSTVFAAGGSVISRSRTGRWRTVPQPPGAHSARTIRAVGGRRDGAVFAGSSHGTREPGGYWEGAFAARWSRRGLSVDRELAPKLQPLNMGGTAPGGRSVFWSFRRDLLLADRDGMRAFCLARRVRLRGAVPIGDDVYITYYHELGDTAYVARRRFR